MPTFSATYTTSGGQTRNLRVQASDISAARRNLRQRGIVPSSLQQVSSQAGPGAGGKAAAGSLFSVDLNRLMEAKPGVREKALFANKMAALVDAGVPIVRGLSLMAEQQKMPLFKRALVAVTADVTQGEGLGVSMRRWPKVFDKLTIAMVEAGEVGGVLDELQWISLLRSAGAYQMFRQSRQQAIEPKAVAEFLMLNPIFPRSVRYCLERIHETLKIVKGESVPGAPDELECLSGLTLARWSYTSIDALIAGGLHESIDELQSDFNRLHELIEQRYFIAANIAATNVASSAESPCVPA